MNSSNDIAIELKNVFEKYEIELTLDGKSTRESFEALRDISFTVKKGEGIAVMGPNGAGKSTLLRLIAGLLAPEKGEVKVNGRVGSLLDLGAGFHPELTGRDNLLLNASLYHFSREELDKKYEDILSFAGIGKFINAPVRCYSQGMYVRLAFSLAIHVDPDIILIDDCLAVGDDSFRLKCVDKVLEMKTKNKTLILVTHDIELAKQICSRGIYLRDSRIIQDGALQEVAACYLKPVQVDKRLYQYLSAKILEEEERRKLAEGERLRLEEENRLNVVRAEAERLRLEEENRLNVVRAEAERLKLEQENRLKEEEDRRRLEEEDRRRLEQDNLFKEEEDRRRLEQENLFKEEEDRRRLEQENLFKEEEDRRRLEQDNLFKEEEDRLRLEQENRLKEEEDRLRLEQENRLKEEEDRLRLEQENRLKEEEDCLRLEQENLFKEEEDRRIKDLEKRLDITIKAMEKRKHWEEVKRQEHVLFCGPSLKFIISPAKVQIIHHDRELTSFYGMRTHFMIRGKDHYSDSAAWRIKRISNKEVICFLRWTKPASLFQVWRFKSLNNGAVDLEIIIRAPETPLIENEMVEFCLQTPCSVLGEDRFRNKSTIFSCGQKGGLKIETLQKDQVCVIDKEGKDYFRPYFLTVPDRSSPEEARRRRIYFKGRFFSGAQTAISKEPCLASHQLESGRARIEFYDGSCQLILGGKHLTTGLGIYTSLYSNGIWYDSTQAKWKIKASSRKQLTVEGFWPWIPMAQVWKIFLKDEKTVHLSVKMKVFQEMLVNMQETVMMMSVEYKKWSAGKEVKEFLKGFTSNDFFRYCLWAHRADGVSGLSSHSDHLPTVTFKPASMPGHRVIVENSAHIYDVPSRLFHCLRVNKKEGVCFSPGEYEFFKGSIHIKEEKT